MTPEQAEQITQPNPRHAGVAAELTEIIANREKVQALPGESQAAYLLRITAPKRPMKGTVNLARTSITNLTEHPDLIAANYTTLVKPSATDIEKNNQDAIANLAANDLTSKNGTVGAEGGNLETFQKTERGRSFIDTQSEKSQGYYNLLFAGTGDPEIQAVVRDQLVNKKIVNFGGVMQR